MILPMERLVSEFGVRPRAILHIGAHLGEEAGHYAEAGAESVLWVEGNPRLLANLTDIVTRYPGQQAVGAVVSDEDDQPTTLHLTSFSMSSSLLTRKRHKDFYPFIHVEHDEPVTTVTVDTLLSRLGVGHDAFDLANLDIEGTELYALRGMTKVLPHLKWVYAEVNFEEMHEGCAQLGDVDDFLAMRGFARVALEEARYNGNYCGWGDALYARGGAA